MAEHTELSRACKVRDGEPALALGAGGLAKCNWRKRRMRQRRDELTAERTGSAAGGLCTRTSRKTTGAVRADRRARRPTSAVEPMANDRG